MNEEFYKRLNDLRLDKYVVDQGLMLNYLVGALTGIIRLPDDGGTIKAEVIVEAVERAFNHSRKLD